MPLTVTHGTVQPMALRRALEMLKAGEQINDLLYRSTVEGGDRRPARQRLIRLMGPPRSCPGCTRLHAAGLRRSTWLAAQPAT